jgi:hypothetical protein
MRGQGRPVNLARFDPLGWMTSEEDLWAVAEYLDEIPHRPLLAPGQDRGLTRVDARQKAADLLRHPKFHRRQT